MVPEGTKANLINIYNMRSAWYKSQDKIKKPLGTGLSQCKNRKKKRFFR